MGASGSTPDGAYLQVEQSNVAALELYRRLGFTEAYRYCDRVQPR
jgi:ribosomal protein S18 acetylase RimI-like enzyme